MITATNCRAANSLSPVGWPAARTLATRLGHEAAERKARQATIDPRRLVFIDETRAKISMGPLRGCLPRGERLRGQGPFGRWQIMTSLAALRCDRIDAPWVVDGLINGAAFLRYVKTELVPMLAPGKIVVMDTLGSR